MSGVNIPQPMFDRVIVELFMERGVTEGGIHLPDTARKVTNSGLVVGVGPGKPVEGAESVTMLSPESPQGRLQRPTYPMTVEVGDTVYFAEYTGHQISVGKRSYMVIREEELLAIEKSPKQEG